jgi:hypothetical protein
MEQLTIPVANVAALLTAGYTTIEVWAAQDADDLPLQFSEITGPVGLPASIACAVAANTYAMGGATLKFQLKDGVVHTVSFSALVANWTPTQVADQINTVLPGFASVVTDVTGTYVNLTDTLTSGRLSTILIVYSDSPNLGLTSGQQAAGIDGRIPLVSGTVLYGYVDQQGLPDTVYQWRFSANGVSPISQFYPVPPISGSPPPIPGLNLSIAVAQFSDLTGRPVQRTLVIVSDFSPDVFSGAPSIGVGNEEPLLVQSDQNGFLQIPLVQGAKVRIAIEGTAYVREIVVPTGVTTFDLLTALATAPDPFTIQTVAPFLIRESI